LFCHFGAKLAWPTFSCFSPDLPHFSPKFAHFSCFTNPKNLLKSIFHICEPYFGLLIFIFCYFSPQVRRRDPRICAARRASGAPAAGV
jgi:hypothetical protein